MIISISSPTYLLCGAGPWTPPPPLGAGSQQLCSACSGVSRMCSCLWRGSPGPPSPRWGPAVNNFALPFRCQWAVLLFCISSGLRLASSLTHQGEATPPPIYHSKFILSAGLLPPFTLSPLGPVVLRHLVFSHYYVGALYTVHSGHS